MGSRKKRSIGFIISLIFFLIVTVGLILVFLIPLIHHKKELPVLGDPDHRVGAFSLFDQDGKKITNTDVAGKIRVVEYFFTTCKGICPIMNTNLRKVDEIFRNDKDVIILSHTVDPGTDSVSVMKSYADAMNAKTGKWYFLTGNKKELYTLATKDYLLNVDSTGVDIDHQFIHTPMVALVDRQNKIRGFYDATDRKQVQLLIEDIKALD